MLFQDFIDKKTSPLKNSKGRKNANFQGQQNSQFPSVSFHNHPLNKVIKKTNHLLELEYSGDPKTGHVRF